MQRSRDLFVYGTLTNTDLLREITGRDFRVIKARLEGYRIVAVGQYRGLKMDGASSVEGQLILDVDDRSLRKLDEYESELYRRIEVKVKLSNGRLVNAHAYIQRYPDSRD